MSIALAFFISIGALVMVGFFGLIVKGITSKWDPETDELPVQAEPEEWELQLG